MFPENLKGLQLFIAKIWALESAGSAVSVYDLINVMKVCFDVNVITSVFTYFWCMLSKTTQTKCVFPHV